MSSHSMELKAIGLVASYIKEHLDKSDPEAYFEVFTVWKCKTLQNWKFLISSTLPGEHVQDNCFLCEFAGLRQCNNRCPIKWCDGDYNICAGVGVDYRFSPISEILALPEKEVKGPAFKIDDKATPYIAEGPSPVVMMMKELGQASGLPTWAPVNEHIEAIRSRGFIAGQDALLGKIRNTRKSD